MKKALEIMTHLAEIKKKYQIKALQMKLQQGKVKNPYALAKKIDMLKREINAYGNRIAWNNYLAQ
jgi:hypothetical protein